MTIDFYREMLLRHPLAEPTDAVKLLYQNEFGCGHLLPEETDCARRVAAELAVTTPDEAEPPFEPIGNGLCRLNLRHPLTRRLPPERIARMMALSQREGLLARFQGKLTTLEAVTRDDGADAPRLAFALPVLEAYLAAYAAAGYPPVHHSDAYREAYRPAYRVVLRAFGEALPVLGALEDRLRSKGRALLVLDGDCGAGKTTLARLLKPLYGASVLAMDDFFLPFALRTPERMKQPGGNIHYERFAREVLPGLLSGRSFAYRGFDCHRGLSWEVQVPATDVTIVEGSYSLHPYFGDAYRALDAVRVMLRVSPEEQLRRIRLRSGKKLLERFRNEWIPLEKSYFEAYHRGRTDLLVLESRRHEEDEEENS